jgi:hypothetical protein
MSDRQSSVRTQDAGTGESPSTTQAIPTTGGFRAQGPATGATPAGPATGAGAATSAGAVAGPTGSATGSATGRAQSGKRGGKAGRGPRRARLQLRNIDIWSAFKISLVLSIALFFIWMVAVGILYGVLSGLGVFDALNDLFGQFSSASGGDGGGNVITPGIVFGGAAVIGAINVILMTALCTVGTFIYNLCADLVGGLEVTLSERD